MALLLTNISSNASIRNRFLWCLNRTVAGKIPICKNLFINGAYFSGKRSLQTFLVVFLVIFESRVHVGQYCAHKLTFLFNVNKRFLLLRFFKILTSTFLHLCTTRRFKMASVRGSVYCRQFQTNRKSVKLGPTLISPFANPAAISRLLGLTRRDMTSAGPSLIVHTHIHRYRVRQKYHLKFFLPF